jgi:serine protease Do
MEDETKPVSAETAPAGAADKTAPRHKNPRVLGFVLMLLTAVSAGFLGGWLGAGSRDFSALNRNGQTGQRIISSESQAISQIAEQAGQSVVSVNVVSERTVTNPFFGFGDTVERESAGTGVIVSEDGVVVTNRHVVPRGVTRVSVTLSDGTELENVDIIGRTSERDSLDIAFLKINDKKGKDLEPARLGDSSKVLVGERVVAIGNALGQFQNTITTGVISGYGRSVVAADDTGTETLQNLFQTDAAINQGNSGGPLVNLDGEVIGINTAVAGRAENIGFAIPINDLSGLIKSVLETGKLQRPQLGVRYVSLTDDIAFELDLPVKRGAYIVPRGRSAQPSILPDSPAAKAGLKERDVITKINDDAIDERNSLTSVLGRYAVGDTVKLTYLRDGKEQTVDVTLEAAPTD